MVFYFSGTGNAQWVAKELAGRLSLPLVSIADELKRGEGPCEYEIEPGQPVLLVFPIHSWGPAELVMRFVDRLVIRNYGTQPVYAVCVCGDNCALADRILARSLRRRGLPLTAYWSIQMPNNYILMKGFGVDSDQVREAKLEAAPQAVAAVTDAIQGKAPYNHYVAGSHPFIKSRLVYPLFRRFMASETSKTSFHVSEACTGCGMCARNCPTGTIQMKDSQPTWGRGCVQCTACINRCPVRAIDFGNVSQNQGRYHHPECR